MKRAPSDFSDESRKFWNETLKLFELEPHHLKLFEAACRCWDRVVEAREQVEKDGAYFKDRYDQWKPHPALDVETKNKNLFMRLIREMGFSLEKPEHPRPPRQY
jgi:phage terminase small subunit